MINILIVSGGSFQGSTLVKCLCASNSIVVNLADCFNENINKYEADKFHVVPPINDKNHFIDELINIVIKEDIKIIFPSTDYELPVLSENRHIFKKQGAMVAVSELHLIHILRNKLTTHSLLFSNGFNVLNQIDFRSENIELPIIGKPAIGFGSKGIIEIHTQEDYKSLGPKNIKNYIWQPLIIEFTEFSVDFAICFDGNISPLIIRKRLKTAGGFAVITQSECEKKISSEMYRFAQLLSDKGGCGIFNVQILKTLEGDCFFSDVNPRVGTSSVFSLGLSINLPLFMCSFFDSELKNNIFSKKIPPIKMIRNIEEKWIRLFPKKTIDGLIFDLDDTLINQKVWITDKIRIMHQQYKNFLPEKKLFLFVAYRFLEEGKRSTLIDDLISHFNLPNSLRDDLIPAFRIAEPESIYVFKDVLQNLLRLKKTGLKLALLTDNPPSSQRQKLEKLNFKDIFDVIVFSQDLNLEKPEKRVFDEVSNQICISPNKLAMVGDNLYRDIYGALNAGHNFAFYLERKNTFFNFDFDKFIEVSGLATDRIIKITSLNDLYFSLENPITH